MDGRDFFVSGLLRLNVHLVPFLKQFDSLFPPGDTCLGSQIVHSLILELCTPQEEDCLLAVEVVMLAAFDTSYLTPSTIKIKSSMFFLRFRISLNASGFSINIVLIDGSRSAFKSSKTVTLVEPRRSRILACN